MSAWKDRAKERQIRHFGDGETCTIVRLVGKPLRSGVVMQGTAAAGASTITITAPKLAGTVPSGASVSITGDATEYATTADATVEESTDRVTLTVTPVLAAEAEVGTTVTLGANAQASYFRSKHGLDDELVAGTKGAARKVAVYVPDGSEIRSDDLYQDAEGTYAITNIERRGRRYLLMLKGAA